MSQVTHTLKSTSAQCLGAKITWLWVNLRKGCGAATATGACWLFFKRPPQRAGQTSPERWADAADVLWGAVRCHNVCYRWMAMPRWWSSNLGPQAFSFCTFMFESQTGVWVLSRCFKQCSSSFPATLTFRSRRGSNCHALAQPLNLCFLRLSTPHEDNEVTSTAVWTVAEVTTFAILNVMIAVIVESTLDEASRLAGGSNWVLNKGLAWVLKGRQTYS